MRSIDEVGAVILVPLVFAKPLLRLFAVTFHALFPAENVFAFTGTIGEVEGATMGAHFRTIAKLAVGRMRALGSSLPAFVGVLSHDVTGRRVIANEAVFVSPASAADVGAAHPRALRPDQLSIMSALSDLSVFVAHRVAGLRGEVIALAFVVPELDGPHKSFDRTRVAIPEEDVLPDGILLQVS